LLVTLTIANSLKMISCKISFALSEMKELNKYLAKLSQSNCLQHISLIFKVIIRLLKYFLNFYFMKQLWLFPHSRGGVRLGLQKKFYQIFTWWPQHLAISIHDLKIWCLRLAKTLRELPCLILTKFCMTKNQVDIIKMYIDSSSFL